ncbi:MAG: hypothetical protein R2832_14960 [Rhodothermales bacterium]
MNVSDSEIVASVLRGSGFGLTRDRIRPGCRADQHVRHPRSALEQKVHRRLGAFRSRKQKQAPDLKLGVLGCMAERLREKGCSTKKSSSTSSSS